MNKRETAIIKSLPAVAGDAFFGYFTKKEKKKPRDGGEDEDEDMKSEEEEEVDGNLYEFEREYKFNRQESAQARYVLMVLLSYLPPDLPIFFCSKMTRFRLHLRST